MKKNSFKSIKFLKTYYHIDFSGNYMKLNYFGIQKKAKIKNGIKRSNL